MKETVEDTFIINNKIICKPLSKTMVSKSNRCEKTYKIIKTVLVPNWIFIMLDINFEITPSCECLNSKLKDYSGKRLILFVIKTIINALHSNISSNIHCRVLLPTVRSNRLKLDLTVDFSSQTGHLFFAYDRGDRVRRMHVWYKIISILCVIKC